ncbi:MAG: hypothetical protein K6T78_02565 [Alicyclobacillus sp.]|nr:hypothetical protein [Alicyclobacillus sp.]
MKLPRWTAWVALFDCLLFLAGDVGRVYAPPAWMSGVRVGYWLSVWLGVVLAVAGFLALTRGGASQLKRSVTCVLFAMMPACVGLVTVLARIGTPVGGVHV